MSWLNPGLLALLALAAVPIILHFLLRERVQRVAFGALRFLRKQSRELLSRKRWLEWLLTALRVACVVALVIAFARPFFPDAAAERPGNGRDTMILLDVSRSMGYGKRLDQAKSEAEAVVAAAAGGDAITVITFADARNIAAVTAKDRGEALALIRAATPSGGGTDVLAAIDRALNMIGGGGGEVHLISDLQASGVPRRDARRFPRGYRFTVHRIGDGKAAEGGGIAVEGRAFAANITPGERNLTVSARVFNRGGERLCAARLVVAGKDLDSKQVALPQNGETIVTLTGSVKEIGEHAAEIVVDQAPAVLPGDERFRFVVRVVNKVRVVVVNGHPSQERREDAAFFVVPALNVGHDTPFAAEVADKLPELKGIDIVVLASVSSLPAADAQRLADFVNAGGGVFIACGANIDAEAWNDSLGKVAPARLRRWRASADDAYLVPVDPTHPLVAAIVAEGKGDLGTAHFKGYAEVKDSQDAHVVLRFNDDRPAFLEARIGKGASVLFTGCLDRRGDADFPLRPIFLPFARESMRLLLAHADQSQQFAAGDALTVPAGAALELPDGSVRKGEAGGASVTLAGPGMYKLTAGDRVQLIAVNPDPHESDLAALAPAEVAKLVEAAPDVQIRRAGDGLARVLRADQRSEAEHRSNLGWWLLVTLLALLPVELWLAQKVSRK